MLLIILYDFKPIVQHSVRIASHSDQAPRLMFLQKSLRFQVNDLVLNLDLYLLEPLIYFLSVKLRAILNVFS